MQVSTKARAKAKGKGKGKGRGKGRGKVRGKGRGSYLRLQPLQHEAVLWGGQVDGRHPGQLPLLLFRRRHLLHPQEVG